MKSLQTEPVEKGLPDARTGEVDRKSTRLGQGASRQNSCLIEKAISFNLDGFIGFAGWADDRNKSPLIKAFAEWVESIAS